MPITLDQVYDYLTIAGLVVLALTPAAHGLSRLARALRQIAALTAWTGDDRALDKVIPVLDAVANGLDRLVAVLPRVTAGRISATVAQEAVKP